MGTNTHPNGSYKPHQIIRPEINQTYTLTLDPPLELIKQNVLSTTGISMALNTDALQTFTQIVQPSVAA